MSACTSISSRASEYSCQRAWDSASIGENFHCLSGSCWRAANRFAWVSRDTVNQSLNSEMPDSTRACS